jgi:hypothetical protein
MATPNSRESFKQYCLRALGAPVLEINVDDDQLEDRIDEALDYWRQYHYDGIQEMYLKQRIRASTATLTTNNADQFSIATVITGATSGAKATVAGEDNTTSYVHQDNFSSGNNLLIRDIVGTFVDGEVITGTAKTGGNITATLGTNAITQYEYDNKYIEVPDYVWGVTDVLSIGQASSSKNIFDLQYQLRLNDLYDLTSTSIIYYQTVMQHLDLLDWTLNGKDTFRYNRLEGRLYLDVNWKQNVILGDYVLVKAYRALDPTTWSKVWNETWLKEYTIALFKRQWAINIKKFKGIQLPGGVTLDGDSMYQEAMTEIAILRDDLQNKSAPLNFMMG